MKQHLVSISDIARELGVSPSTVSRALKDHPGISSGTKSRVREMARKHNYRHNALASSLRKRTTKTIGLIIPEIAHHFFSSVISGIEELAYSNGYRVMICQSNENTERELDCLYALLDHRVDGILISVSKHTVNFDVFKNIVDSGIPIVFYDRISDELATDRVITDDYQGARLVTAHLISKGRNKILHLAAPKNMPVGKERLRGYQQALREHGIQQRDDLIIQCDTASQVSLLRDDIMRIAPEIDAVFAVNDFTAIATMQLLKRNGYKIPENVAIAGFGDDPIASIVSPMLTTVEQKGYEMGVESMKLLIQRIENGSLEMQPRIKIFESILKVREST